MVRIRTSMERISICFFKPGDLCFRSDSGQMEEDLVALLLKLLSQTILALEELQQAQGQSEEDLIIVDSKSLISCLFSQRLDCKFIIVHILKFNFR